MTAERMTVDQVALGPDPEAGWGLPHADPTGEAVVRRIMHHARADDYAVVDLAGHVLFRIKPDALATVLPHLHFTKTRRGRDNIRAHKKKAPTGQGEGESRIDGDQND
ncbi:MAG: hypothetical protein ACQEW8_10760 [Actinomycetota bacterium]